MKSWSSLAGSAAALSSMAAVLYFHGAELGNLPLTNRQAWSSLAAAIGVYVLVILLGAFAWRFLLAAFGSPASRWAAERQLLVSQIAKYVPGNIAQYLGRASMAMNSGVPAPTVGIALLTEVAGTLTGGLLAIALSVVTAPGVASRVREIMPDDPAIIWLAAPFGGLLILWGGFALLAKLSRRFGSLSGFAFSGLAAATTLYFASFILLGLSLLLTASAFGSSAMSLSFATAVFATAWIAGMVTPGAPGGLGVREAVLTLGLTPYLGGAAALTVALAHRGISILGDLISFGLGLCLPRESHGASGK